MHDTWKAEYVPDADCYWSKYCDKKEWKSKALTSNWDAYRKHQIVKHYDEWNMDGEIPSDRRMWDMLGGIGPRFQDEDEWRGEFELYPEGYMEEHGIKVPKHIEPKETKKKSRWKLI